METIIKNCKKPKFITNIIKGLIFGVMMLAPFLAIAVKCLYVINNRNANLSYSALNENTQDRVYQRSIETINYNKDYYLTGTMLDTSQTSGGAASIYIYDIQVLANPTTNDFTNINRLTMSMGGREIYYDFYQGTTFKFTLLYNQQFTIKFKINSYVGNTAQLANTNTILSNSETLYYIDYFTEQQLDNVFYYAVQEATENPLFSWTQDTAIYTALNGMTTGLEIQGGFLPMLLAYWVLNTMIYLVMDIIIYSINKMIEIISNKK